MPHRKWQGDEGEIQPVILLRENAQGEFEPVLNPAQGSGGGGGVASAVDITGFDNDLVDADGGLKVHVQNQSAGGGGGGVDPVSIKDGSDPTRKLAVDESGRIGISNLPTTQPVSGSVSVSNFPATQPVSGTVTVSNPTANPETGLAKEATLESLRADIANGISAAISNFPATQAVSGTVAVSNHPAAPASYPLPQTQVDTLKPLATQPVSGSVSVSNFPATQPVSGTVTVSNPTANPETGLAKDVTAQAIRDRIPAALDADGGLKVHVQNQSGGSSGGLTNTELRATPVPVSGFPAVQPVSDNGGSLTVDGTVSVGNFPATQPVSGTVAVSNFPATQPVSGTVGISGTVTTNTGLTQPLTDTQLRAAAVPVSLTSVPSHAVTGPLTNTELRATPVPITGTVAIGSGSSYLYKGRASTPITPGRAGTTGHTVFAIWNGSASRIVELNLIGVDLYQTAVKVVGTPPPAIRFYRCAVAPTNGVLLTKVAEDSALSSDAGIVVRGDASADRTSAAAALAATVQAGALNQEYAPRLFTAAGYEMYDKTIFFDQSPMILRPNEGMVMRLEYAAAVSNPITDMWIVNTIWYER